MRYVFFFVMALVIVACKKQDELNPVIRSIKTNGLENDSLMFNTGQENTIVVSAFDKEGLSQMKVEILTLTGLQLERTAPVQLNQVFLEVNQGAWDTLRIANLQGSEVDRQFEFAIPNTIHGKWKLKVTVVDKSGNLTEEERDLFMKNEQIPKFSLSATTPTYDVNGAIPFSVGDSVSLSGEWLDTTGLDFIFAEISNDSGVFWSQEFSELSGNSFDLNQLICPAIQNAGKYVYSITARNTNGFENKVRAELLVD